MSFMRHSVAMVASLVLFACAAEGEASPMLRQPIPVELIAGASELPPSSRALPALSPDGKLLAFTVSNGTKQRPLPGVHSDWMYTATGVANTHSGDELWILDIQKDKSFAVHPDALASFSPAWSTDGQHLAFYSDRAGTLGLWVWDRQDGGSRRVAKTIARPGQIDGAPVWLNEHEIFAKFLPDDMTVQTVERAIYLQPPVPSTGLQDTVTVQVRGEGPGQPLPKYFYGNLGVADIRTGEVRPIVERKSIRNWSVAPDGSLVAYDEWVGSGICDFTVVAVGNRAQKLVLTGQRFAPEYSWSPDARKLYYKQRFTPSYQGQVDPAPDPGLTIDTHDWTRTPYTQAAKMQTHDEPLRKGHLIVVPLHNGSFIADITDVTRYGDLWLFNKHGTATKQLTHLNPELERYEGGTTMKVEWTDPQGRKLMGALLLPVGYTVGKRYPLHVNVYGGRSLSHEWTSPGLAGDVSPQWNYQVLASRGYAVFFPEAPYGENRVVKDLTDAVMSGIDKVVDLGIADPQRLSIEGQSFGGYCVRALITQTTRFKAAISTAGVSGNITDLYPFKGQSRVTADLYRDRDIVMANAPMFGYGNVKTPLLIQVGMNDGHGNNESTYWDYDVFRHLGIDTELLQYYGEGHILLGYSNQVDFWNRRIAWLERHR